MTIYLYFPKLKGTAGFAPGQLSTIAGMYYCKGRFGERTYTRKERSYTYYFKLTHDPIAKKIMHDVALAKKELDKIQKLYIKLGIDPDLHNANYEIQMDYDPLADEYMLWGHRHKNNEGRATAYFGPSFVKLCIKYRVDLEKDIKGFN